MLVGVVFRVHLVADTAPDLIDDSLVGLVGVLRFDDLQERS